MTRVVRLGLTLSLCAALLFPQSSPARPPAQAVPPAANVPNPQTAPSTADLESFITQAGMSYYNLRMAGLGGFQCDIEPDWNGFLAPMRKADPDSADATVRIFSALHFTVAVGPDGRTTLDHEGAITDNRQLAQAIMGVINGMENITHGFFDTWVLFALASPLPDPAAQNLQIQRLDSQYRLSYREGPADVVIDLGPDFGMRDLRLTQPGFRTLLEPVFSHTENGLVLQSYSYRAEVGNDPSAPDFHVHVAIDYQQVDGFQLPRHLDVNGSAGPNPFAFTLNLSNCQTVRNSANPSV